LVLFTTLKKVCAMELSTTYLPVWMQRAMSAPYPTRFDFPDSSHVSVFPGQGRYASDIQDWAASSVLMPDMPEFTPLSETAPAEPSLPLIELHWTLTLQRLAQLQRRAQDYDFRFSLVQLVSWPSLTRLPQDIQPAMARLCALLARKPSAASLLPLLLELPETQVFMLIEALRLYGHVQVSGLTSEADSAARASAPPQPAPVAAQPGQPAAAPSLIAKIWQRLITGA
jgi:hypothetical protein